MLRPQRLVPASELVSSSPALLRAGKPWAGRSWPFSKGEIPAKAAVSSQERSGPRICPLASRSRPLLPSVPPRPAEPQALGGALRWKSCPQGWWSCSLDNPDKKLTSDNPLQQKIPRRLFSSLGRRWDVVTTLPIPEEIPWWRHLALWPASGALSFSDPCCRAPKTRRIFLKCCWSMQAAAVIAPGMLSGGCSWVYFAGGGLPLTNPRVKRGAPSAPAAAGLPLMHTLLVWL